MTPEFCKTCGAPLEQPETGRKRRYCGVACRRKQEAALDRIRRTRAHGERERCRYWNPSATDWRESWRGCRRRGRGRVKSPEGDDPRNRTVPHARKIPPVLKTIKLTAATEPPPEAVFLRLPSACFTLALT